MVIKLQLKFDAEQQHQLHAIDSVTRLFEGLHRQEKTLMLQAEIVPNLPKFETLNVNWLYDNLRFIQEDNKIKVSALGQIDVDDGMVLEGAGMESWRYPSFTVEMETGTGKTYAYLRSIHELRQQYGFSKFVVVVPSIAIYEGVIKNFEITKDHFAALYGNETINLTKYDSARISQLRSFASSTFVEILVMTIASFNKASGRTRNNLYKPSEKLPGERLPYQYIQETRPILILDEPQNMESKLAKEALRTLHPLFALRYSATHRTSPNLVYRLSPFDAYRLNLVKKIQVFGVTEKENFNQPFLALQSIQIYADKKPTCKVRTYITDGSRTKESELTLKQGEDLYEKTKRKAHRGGYQVADINAAQKFLEFKNGIRLQTQETIGPSRPEIFRVQIRTAIKQHMAMQFKMLRKEIKVLSLFFIDRVANYVEEDGIIKTIFEEEYLQLQKQYPFFEKLDVKEVQGSYFAKNKPKKGEAEGEAIDTEGKNKPQREAEKAAFNLIMRDKEKLLSFEEKTCFIFAHSALKEGWDNPNVFQICTLNQTVSEVKKRQEIGRGLRLAVDQTGERIFDDDVNVLSVIANESYESYASRLQTEYEEDGLAAPPKITNAARKKAKRNEVIFTQNRAFQDFWDKLRKQTDYQIHVDTSELIEHCINRINNRTTPQATITVERGEFVMTDYKIELASLGEENCKLKITIADTLGNSQERILNCKKNTDLGKELKDEVLRNYKIVEILSEGETPSVQFGNGEKLVKGSRIQFQSQKGQNVKEKATLAPGQTYPVPNIIDRAAKETGLTRPTINKIFKGLSDRKKNSIFGNPEGFSGIFITEIQNELADHIAERIEFKISPVVQDDEVNLEDLFPAEKEYPQKELVDGSPAGLYDQIQIDSDEESRFVCDYLNEDQDVVFYFKFPPTFKINFPRIIGNYNPDWGIARIGEDGEVTLELVRETKGGEDIAKLRFPHEKRKVICAEKHFKALGIDYRVVMAKPGWWRPGAVLPNQDEMF